MFASKPPPHLPDEERQRHPGWRRTTRRYRRKRRIVKNIWIGAGVLAIALPSAMPVLLLGTTFIAFMILDETP